VSTEYAPSPSNNSVIKEGEDKDAFGVRIKVRQGDAIFERLKFILGTSTSVYTRQFTEASLWDGTTELDRVVLNSTTVVKDSSNYVVTLDGFKRLIKAGENADFVVKLKAYSQIDSTYTTTDPSAISVPENGVRTVDGSAINQYAPSTALGARTVDLQQGEAEQAELVMSRNADYPKAYRAVADTQGEADHVVMNIIDAKAKKGRVKITDWAASIAEVTDGNATGSTAYLYRKDGSSWKLIASATITTNGWTWADMTDEWVEKDATNTYKIEVKFTGASTTEARYDFSNATAADVTAQNELGDTITPSESLGTGSAVFVATRGPIYTFTGSTLKYTKASVAGASGTLEGSFTFKMKASGADVYASQTGAIIVTILDDDGTTTTSVSFGTVVYSQPSGTQTSGDTYQIPQDGEVTFVVNYSILSGALLVSNFAAGESFKLRLTTIEWAPTNAGTATSDTYMDAAVWETGWVTVSD